MDPVAICDGDGGITQRFEYSPFGRVSFMDADFTPDSTPEPWDFLFHGEFRDAATGYYNYGYRFYNDTTGRWLSRDPIGEGGGVNLYGFVGNDGVDAIDRLGMDVAGRPESAGVPDGSCTNGNCLGDALRSGHAIEPKTFDAMLDALGNAGCKRWQGVAVNENGRKDPFNMPVGANGSPPSYCGEGKALTIVYYLATKEDSPAIWRDSITGKSLKPGNIRQDSIHVIYEDCDNKGTFKASEGLGSKEKPTPKWKGITIPEVAAMYYYGDIALFGGPLFLAYYYLRSFYFCCPCPKKESTGFIYHTTQTCKYEDDDNENSARY